MCADQACKVDLVEEGILQALRRLIGEPEEHFFAEDKSISTPRSRSKTPTYLNLAKDASKSTFSPRSSKAIRDAISKSPKSPKSPASIKSSIKSPISHSQTPKKSRNVLSIQASPDHIHGYTFLTL